MIRLVCRGVPVTQGSKTGIVVGGRAVVVEGGNKDARQRHKDWRSAVASEARAWMNEHRRLTGPIKAPVIVRLTFALNGPAASKPKHTRWFPSGRQSGDADKLARSILDSLTGVVIEDDAQVVGLLVVKDYGSPAGVTVEIEAAPQTEVYGDDWTREINWRPAPPPAVALAMPETA